MLFGVGLSGEIDDGWLFWVSSGWVWVEFEWKCEMESRLDWAFGKVGGSLGIFKLHQTIG